MTPRIMLALAMHLILNSTLGSYLEFKKTPDTVKTLITKRMYLECRVKSNNIPTDIGMLNSILIMKDSVDIAAITGRNPPIVLVKDPSFSVTGYINKTSSEGYLKLTWEGPTEELVGSYLCEANGISDIGHSLIMTEIVKVDVETPSFNDLVTYLYSFKTASIKDINDIKKKNEILNTELINATKQILDLKKDNENVHIELNKKAKELVGLRTELEGFKTLQDQHNKEMVAKDKKLEAKDTELATTIKIKTHIETGATWCGDSDNWNDGVKALTREDGYTDDYNTKLVKVKFTSSYNTPPLVSVAILDAWWDDDKSAGLRLDALNVSREGFTVRCALVNNNYHSNYIWYLRVRWTSFNK